MRRWKANDTMKIIHTADWRLGNLFYGHDRTREYELFFEWLAAEAREREAGAIIVGGSVFDCGEPSAEAIGLFCRGIMELKGGGAKIVVTGGCRDSGARLESLRELMGAMGVEVRGRLKRDATGGVSAADLFVPIEADEEGTPKMVALAVPCLRGELALENGNEARTVGTFIDGLLRAGRERWRNECRYVIVAEGGEVTETAVKAIGGEPDYVALGGGKGGRVGDRLNIWRAGMALPCSFEDGTEGTGANLVTIEGGKTRVERLKYEAPCKLISIGGGEDEDVDYVCRLINKLPAKGGSGLRLPWMKGNATDGEPEAYVEVRVARRYWGDDTMTRIERALAGRAVRLCRIVRGSERTNAEKEQPQNGHGKMEIAQVAREYYRKKRGRLMDDDMARLFAEAKREAQAEERTATGKGTTTTEKEEGDEN